MTQTPDEAYRAAKAVRDARIKKEMDDAKRKFDFPEHAGKRMQEIVDFLPSITPAGLTTEAFVSKEGNLGSRGVTGAFFKLKHGEEVLCQGSISCRDDEMVVLTGLPPERDQRPHQKFPEFSLDRLTNEVVSDFMAKIITHFVT